MATPKIFKWALPFLLTLTASPTGGEALEENRDRLTLEGPVVRQSIKNDISPPLRNLIIQTSEGTFDFREIPLRPFPRSESPIVPQTRMSPIDPAIQTEVGPLAMPLPTESFEGISNSDNQAVTGFSILPPDTNGDVGPNHYVQMMNIVFAIWDKSGTLLFGPAANNVLWSSFGGLCETMNQGDPIVLYDQLADRWLMSQFAFDVNGFDDPVGPYHQCIAISQTPDPTGSWNLYDFLIHETKLNDYPKFGIWPDGYYMSINQFDQNSNFDFTGAGVVAFERDKMLSGDPAQMVYFDLDLNRSGMLPSDLDGPTLPPANSPNYFAQVDDTNFGFPQDQLEIWEFTVDWNTPGNSTFLETDLLPTAPFDPNLCDFNRNCIPQPGTTQRVDAISDRLMFRLAYRNFGTHESLVANHTVDADGSDHAGVRWYELRNSGGGWTIENQGTYAPDSDHRWMGSIAMDQDGNIALGYSVSSNTTFPSIRYTGRLADDPANQLNQGEAELIAGGGSQTDPAARWGDYSMMAVDPVDDCTFWYTQEYYETTSDRGWQTRIGSFKFSSCGSADLSLTKSDSPDPVIAGTNLTYTLVVTNGGTNDATEVTLTDTLPGSVNFVSATPNQGTCGESGGVVTCEFGEVDNGNTAMVDIVVIPNTEGLITNTATVTADEGDPDTNNNTVMEDTTINPSADVTISISDSPDPVLAGNTLTYRTTVGNNGPSDASTVTLTQTLPAGVTFSSATPDQGSCNESGGTVSCDLETVGIGQTVLVDILITPLTAADTIATTGDVIALETDPDLSSNSDIIYTAVTGISVSPSGHFFGDVPVGNDSPPQTFTVSNSGTIDLILFPLVLSGADPGEFQIPALDDTCSGQTIPASGNCTFDALFSPLTPGTKNANISIPSNDPVLSTLNVPISGTQQYTITLSKSGIGDGTVFSSPAGISCDPTCQAIFNSDTVVTLNAAPALGSEFSGWSGDPDCSDGQVTIVADVGCTATFDIASYTLSIELEGGGAGSVSSVPPGINCGTDCSEDYIFGTDVVLTALPGSESTFSGWSGDCAGTDSAVTVSITSPAFCTAEFTLKNYTLSVIIDGVGTGTVSSNPGGINCGNDCAQSYASGTEVELTVLPDSGIIFTGWSDDPDCTDGKVIMTSDISCTANLLKAGDVDGSGRVDGFDLGRLGLAFGSQEGDPNWNPDADLNGDGRVDNGDVQILSDHFGSNH